MPRASTGRTRRSATHAHAARHCKTTSSGCGSGWGAGSDMPAQLCRRTRDVNPRQPSCNKVPLGTSPRRCPAGQWIAPSSGRTGMRPAQGGGSATGYRALSRWPDHQDPPPLQRVGPADANRRETPRPDFRPQGLRPRDGGRPARAGRVAGPFRDIAEAVPYRAMDKGYDADRIRDWAEARDAIPVIPCAATARPARASTRPSTRYATWSSAASDGSRTVAAWRPATTRRLRASSASSISHASGSGSGVLSTRPRTPGGIMRAGELAARFAPPPSAVAVNRSSKRPRTFPEPSSEMSFVPRIDSERSSNTSSCLSIGKTAKLFGKPSAPSITVRRGGVPIRLNHFVRFEPVPWPISGSSL